MTSVIIKIKNIKQSEIENWNKIYTSSLIRDFLIQNFSVLENNIDICMKFEGNHTHPL